MLYMRIFGHREEKLSILRTQCHMDESLRTDTLTDITMPRQTGTNTDRQADRQTDRQADRRTDRQTDRQFGRNDICFVVLANSGLDHWAA